jgi:hypothetical protein
MVLPADRKPSEKRYRPVAARLSRSIVKPTWRLSDRAEVPIDRGHSGWLPPARLDKPQAAQRRNQIVPRSWSITGPERGLSDNDAPFGVPPLKKVALSFISLNWLLV